MRTRLAISVLTAAAAATALTPAAASAFEQSFTQVGSQDFTVPPGVTSIHVTAQGASGGDASTDDVNSFGGRGGIISADIPVSAGDVLKVHVGAAGFTVSHGVNNVCNTDSAHKNAPGGANGGGSGGAGGISSPNGAIGGGGGGGATDLRLPGDQSTDRLIAAGGGGGATCTGADGGDAGTNDGAGSDGAPSSGGGASKGAPGLSGGNAGTHGAGGPGAGANAGHDGSDGTTAGLGGNGGDGSPGDGDGGGAGGGGWVGGGGGGGGGSTSAGGAGGAGSSGAVAGATNVTNATAAAAGDGSLKIEWKRPPATTVSCDAPAVIGATVTCTATVTDTTSGTPTTPTGTIAFATDGPGSFDAANCVLTATVSGSARCTASYSPTDVGSGTHKISAAYGGDGNFTAGQGSTGLPVTPSPSQTVVSCAPKAVTTGETTTCSVIVIASTPVMPGGTVALASNGDGVIAGSCPLAFGGCTITYKPNAVGSGTHTITAAYGGDARTAASSGSTTVAVTQPPPAVKPIVLSATLSHRRVRLVRGRASLAITCHGPAGSTCNGSVRLAKTTAFRIAAGKSKVLRVPISARLKTTLKKHKKAAATVTFKVTQASGQASLKKVKITIVR